MVPPLEHCEIGCWFLHAALSPLDLPQEPPVVITAPTATLAAAVWQRQVPGLAQSAWLLPFPKPGRRYQYHSSLPSSFSPPDRLQGGPSGGFSLFLLWLSLLQHRFTQHIFPLHPHLELSCLLSLLSFQEHYMKLSPEVERLGAQVLLCREQTLPPDPQGLCRGADPRELGGVGCALLHPTGAQSM